MLCVRMVFLLCLLDFFGKIETVPYQRLKKVPVSLTWADLNKAGYLVSSDGMIHAGFDAIKKISVLVISLVWMAPLFWIPGSRFWFNKFYNYVAKNRHKLFGRRSVCQCQSEFDYSPDK